MAEEMNATKVKRIRKIMEGLTYMTLHRPSVAPPYMVQLPSSFMGNLEYNHPNETTCNFVGYGQTEEEALVQALNQRLEKKGSPKLE